MRNNINTRALRTTATESDYSPPAANFLGYRYIPAERQLLHSFLSNKLVLGATILFIFFVICAVFAYWVAPVEVVSLDVRSFSSINLLKRSEGKPGAISSIFASL